MSRAQRPTRSETRERLLQAAARLFADRGIGATTIEQICEQADFSRGAFYSNFAAKDELVIALLDAHIEASTSEMTRMFEASANPVDFLMGMESADRKREGPLDFAGGPMLRLELLLYALRNPEIRPRLVDQQRRLRQFNTAIIERIVEAVGRGYPCPIDDVVSVVMGFDEGLSTLMLVDPESYRERQFSETMVMLHELWLSSPTDESSA